MNVIKAAHLIPNHKATNKIAFVNHGGITVASKPGIAIAKLETRLKPTTFEYLCCKVSAGCTSFIVVAVYRPGSQHITDAFFHEFTTLLESLAAFNCKTVVAGDLMSISSVCMIANTPRLIEVIQEFNMQRFVETSTHDLGGLLDVAITSHDFLPSEVVADESGLSDNKLIHWRLDNACH